MNMKFEQFCKALLSLVSASLFGTAAIGDEGSLTLPKSTDAPLSVTFAHEDVNWDTAKLPDLLQVFVGKEENCCTGRTPMSGRYKRDQGRVLFVPAFEFDRNQDYVVRVAGSAKLSPFRIEGDRSDLAAAVTAVFPSGDTLPENTLRFYIHFSVPMQPHVAFKYINLRNADGEVDDAAFMQFKQELWNKDRTRLTVLIDPGRIKRGVATNLELGPALLRGQRYSLSVAAGWPSADGLTVTSEFTKTFTVAEPLRSRIDIARWTVSAPQVGSLDPLRIDFDRPFDRQLLLKHMSIVTPDGREIQGNPEVGAGEKHWLFHPISLWRDDKVLLLSQGTLEDVAGNNFRDLLEHETGTEISEIPYVTLPIELRKH